MSPRRNHSENILETPVSTVTSGGHWFYATRSTIEEYVPGLLKKHSFEEMITKAVAWIKSADSIAMMLYLLLAFLINPWLAALISFVFHYGWYHQKSAFVNIPLTPVLKFINYDFFQLLLAAVLLSFMGINGMYTAVTLGILFFFLYKVGLLRRLWDKIRKNQNSEQLPLNDKVLRMVLIKYSVWEDIPPSHIEKMDSHLRDTIIEINKKKE